MIDAGRPANYETMVVSNQIWLSPPAIARLLCRGRVTAWRYLNGGNFGPPVKRGRISYVPLAAVECFTNSTFTESQIDAAVRNVPTRRLTIPQEAE
jgi:hypothetical protein